MAEPMNPDTATSDRTRDDLVYKAKLAEQAERYEDMVASMREVYMCAHIWKLITYLLLP